MYFFMYLGIFINIFFIALYICASYQMVFLVLFRNMLYNKHRKSVQWNLSIPNIFLNTCCFIQNWQVFWLDRLNGQWCQIFEVQNWQVLRLDRLEEQRFLIQYTPSFKAIISAMKIWSCKRGGLSCSTSEIWLHSPLVGVTL